RDLLSEQKYPILLSTCVRATGSPVGDGHGSPNLFAPAEIRGRLRTGRDGRRTVRDQSGPIRTVRDHSGPCRAQNRLGQRGSAQPFERWFVLRPRRCAAFATAARPKRMLWLLWDAHDPGSGCADHPPPFGNATRVTPVCSVRPTTAPEPRM